MKRLFEIDAAAGLLAVLLVSLPAASQAAAQSTDAVVYAPSQGDMNNECSAHGDNCNETACCQNENETCYAKNDEYATCRTECEPGIHEGDGEGFQTPWSCTTPEMWKCSKENENCAETACCQNPDFKCFRKNHKFASCKASCEPGVHADDDADFQTPWNCTEVTQVCGEVYQQCGGKGWDGPTCCKEGCTCEVTSVYYHQCSRADVGVGDNDGSANTCSGAPAPPPQTEAEADKNKKKHSAKKPARTSSSRSAPPPLATVHAQVAGERAAPKKSKAPKGAPAPLATGHPQAAGERVSAADETVDDWGIDDDNDDDDDWDVDLAEQLPHGAAAVPTTRRVMPVAWTAAAGLGIALVLVSSAAVGRGRWRSSHSHELPGVSEEELLESSLE